MKYFYKLFLSIVLLLTVLLSVLEYFSVAYSLDHAFDRELESELTGHQLVKNTIQTALLSVQEVGGLSSQVLADIGESAASGLSSGGGLQLSDAQGEVYFSSLSLSAELGEPAEQTVNYAILSGAGGKVLLRAESRFSQSGRSLALITERDISGIFDEAETLLQQYTRLYLIVLVVGALASLLLSWFLTRPLAALRRVSGEFASGNYQARSNIKTRDEVGELACAYNHMADTIEDKICELEDAAERQERFTASFAHELKTPMTSIIGYADTIYQKNLSKEEIRQCAWYIMNEGMRLEALSFKLMELQTLRRCDFTLEETEVSVVLRDSAEAISPAAAKRGVELLCSFDSSWVRLERDLFKTLLLNLLDNALKSGGSHVQFRGEAEDAFYRISITDNGRGIPEQSLRRITEAFYMVDKSRSRREHGAGLGLTLANQIAEIHGSSLNFESITGKGTRVTLFLKREADFYEE